ncbi:hypothetical protein ACRS5S_03000 [Nocardia asiatica]|nr:hypothetical protein [Nocardia asiatica]
MASGGCCLTPLLLGGPQAVAEVAHEMFSPRAAGIAPASHP